MKNLKMIREPRKMTQDNLAIKSGVLRVTISMIENGNISDIKVSTLLKLASALEVCTHSVHTRGQTPWLNSSL